MATAVEVEFAPAPAYIFDYLTADILTAECIFDLIDNSIDAARAAMTEESRGSTLPEQYDGYRIAVTLTPERVSIHDNCSGMSEETFARSAFRAGEKSRHPYGIGHFGVGLKRAILKLGDRCVVDTDDGISRMSLSFTRSALDQAADSAIFKLPASKLETTGLKYTTITVDQIRADTRRDLSSPRWNETIRANISRRYGLFVRKGLSIEIDGVAVKPFAPQPKPNPYIEIQTFSGQIHGVDVHIIAGVHEDYKFAETGTGVVADQSNNLTHRAIAGEFGWYVVCNDRVILLHDKTHKTGWLTNWHGEYNGFVGWVYFESKDPSLLPWNTKKSDIVENGEVYDETIAILQKMANTYRQTTPLAKGRRGGTKPPAAVGSKPSSVKLSDRAEKPPTAASVLAGATSKNRLHSIPTVLPPDIPFSSRSPKLAGLVDECGRLTISQYPYASAVMLRTVFDTALRDFLKRHDHFKTMRDQIFEGGLEKGVEATAEQRKIYNPSLADMVRWCTNHPEVFPDPYVRPCKQSCQRFAAHLKILNGVVHEDGGISNAAQVMTMRDEVLQGLLHFIAT